MQSQRSMEIGVFKDLGPGYRSDYHEAAETVLAHGKDQLFEDHNWDGLRALGRTANAIDAYRLRKLVGEAYRPSE